MNKQDKITDNFTYGEFWSGDRKLGKNSIEPPEPYMVFLIACIKELQIVRDIIKVPIVITSAYSTPDWNRINGGSKNSLHLKSLAVDTRAIGLPLFVYYSYLLKYTKFNQYGYYRWKNFVHSGLMNDFVIFKY